MAKYNAKKGRKYKSGPESLTAQRLGNMKIKFEYEPDEIPYVLEKDYKPDFKLDNGVYLEVKGQLYRADRTKMLAVKKQHPNLDIRFVFQKPHQKCAEGVKATNAEWAEKNGFPWYDVKEFKSKDLL